MNDIVIKAENLGKKYIIGHNLQEGRYLALRDVLMQNIKNMWNKTKDIAKGNPVIQGDSMEEVWALKDVNFEIQRGEAVGIIGRNGAGKSTLLKILSRITEPSSGRVIIKDRIASLLEVGTGFHPELTGRENIYLNGTILGMTRKEIKRKFDEIVDFAEIEKYLDTPVKRYSSGMYVRLAFAVAAHLEPEILVVDEVLAVGDAAFQKKCLGKMGNVTTEGRTVLFVSHNMAAIRTLCSRVAVLESGKIKGPGDPAIFIKEYLTGNNTSSAFWKRNTDFPPQPGIFFEEIRIENTDGQCTDTMMSTHPFHIILSIWSSENFSGTQIAIRVTNQEGIPVFTTTNSDTLREFCFMQRGYHKFRINFPDNFFSPGQYTLIVASFIPGIKLFDSVEDKLGFRIEDLGTHATIMKDGRLGVVTPIFPWNEI